MDYEIIETIAELSRTEYKNKDDIITKEINLISFSGKKPVYDIRRWKIAKDGTREMYRGITLSSDEINVMMSVISERGNL